MRCQQLLIATAVTFIIACATPASAGIVQTQVRASIPTNGSYTIDLDGDGAVDFTITSKLIQAYCLAGDQFLWGVTVTPAARDGVVIDQELALGTFAAALLTGVRVDASRTFSNSPATMAAMNWGSCGGGTSGEWLNVPNRYLGLKFYSADHTLHYGWAKLTTAAYVDQYGNFHTTTVVSSFAYETVPGQQIMAGQTAETP